MNAPLIQKFYFSKIRAVVSCYNLFVHFHLGLYPEEREMIYKYEAVVTTGTEFPAPFISRFNLTGNIKMQSLLAHTRVQVIAVLQDLQDLLFFH